MSFFNCINNKILLNVDIIKTYTTIIKIELDEKTIYEGELINSLQVDTRPIDSGILKLYFNINNVLYYAEKTNLAYSNYKLTNDKYKELVSEFNKSWEDKLK